MKSRIKAFLKRISRENNPISPLINIYLSKRALIYNLHRFKGIVHGKEIAPVLKGNAYGHGLKEISNILKDEKVPFYIIDSYFEAKALRNEGIKNPLLIIGYSSIDSILNNKLNDISFTITSIEALIELSRKIHKKIIIHLKLDTGMHRQGILIDEIYKVIEIIEKNNNIILEGICSHLADADNTDTSFTKDQIEKWNNIVKIFRKRFGSLKYWHISATAGIIYKEAEANLIRLGIGLYGLMDFTGIETEPILELRTIISGIKKIKRGNKVGYNSTFTAMDDMTIATIPMGYYEGIDRRLSNHGFVKIQNTFCPIVGRVSMNITVIDISNIYNVKINDEVIVISNKREDKNSIENIAKICETIPYEITVHIAPHLKRNIVD